MAAPRNAQTPTANQNVWGASSVRLYPGCSGLKDILKFLFIAHYWLHVSARNSLLDDILLPYPLSKHGPNHSHREIRDCLPVTHGNTTYEVWPSNNNTALPVASSKMFASVFPGDAPKTVHGHFTFINNPLKTISVLEPGGDGGCSKNATATVEETIKSTKCLVAQNGGFFNIKSGECLGNVVSNGKLIQNSKGIQNAQFGIKADGTMVFGYLSEEQVLDEENPFVQLVSGVVWLLRKGEIYIKESKLAECDKTQDTGSFDYFVDVISARTAVGHDKDGRLVLFHVDGQTSARGLSLWEMADFLKKQGVINAINLDGGGSATYVVNGTLSNYPSDHCLDPMWRCPRSISTVLCIHEPYCDPPDCNGHGQCVSGECQCTGFWTGPTCSALYCDASNCSMHGVCTEGGCVCENGWIGSSCNNGDSGIEPVTYTTQTHIFQTSKSFCLTGYIWIIITCTLAVLLLVSAAINVKQASCWKERHTEWKYSYQQLNGDMDAVEIYEPWDLKEKEYDQETLNPEAGS
uniref:N-acetylglucosamine-1-phosphodiester alpha-N-acetylglucosaminidase n=1 Tax=Leptobrachium leishanense TaxID=445787 RepID=A0A8C5MDY0_9ANUR